MAQATNNTTTTRLQTAPKRRRGVPDALAALAAATGETKIAALHELARLREQAERTIERLMAFLDSTEPDADLEPSLGAPPGSGVVFDGEGDGLEAGELDESEHEQDLTTPDRMMNQVHATMTKGWNEGEQGNVILSKIDAARTRAAKRNARPANGSDVVVYSPFDSEGAALAKAQLRKLASRA